MTNVQEFMQRIAECSDEDIEERHVLYLAEAIGIMRAQADMIDRLTQIKENNNG